MRIIDERETQKQKKQKKKKTKKKERQKRTRGDKIYSESVRAKWFCCAFLS